MTSVTYDDRSLLLDDRRLWLVSGSIDYFRIPASQWADRLGKARAAGLNCIATSLAWNVHEPQEGQWDFAGDADVGQFIRLADEAGLYVILRVGPYIGDGMDFGALPAWLSTKSGMSYRTASAAYMHYLDKYLAQALPRLSSLQASAGGNIVLVQNESHYVFTTHPDRLNYLKFISQLIARAGFDVPIITCNDLTDPPLRPAIETAAGFDDAVNQLHQLRRRQDELPLFLMELPSAEPDVWGREHHHRGPRETARRALEAIGCGAQVNIHPFCGGTNFGFSAGRLPDGPDRYVTTSWDRSAPVAEGGGLTDKYYLLRLVNLPASTLGCHLAQARIEAPGATLRRGPQVLNVTGPDGSWLVVSNGGDESVTEARVALPTGAELDVSLAPLGAALLPYELRLTDKIRVDRVDLMPLGFFGASTLVLHGPAGREGHICVNGTTTALQAPPEGKVQVQQAGPLRVVVVDSHTAQRTWCVDETLVFGADFVGPSLEDIQPGSGPLTLMPLSGDQAGKLKRKAKPSSSGRKAATPRLRDWHLAAVCDEPLDPDGLDWESLGKPRSLSSLGLDYGYAWLRCRMDFPRAKRRYLLLPECEDRATLFLNGRRIGLWGRGPRGQREPVFASFRKGPNTLTMLVDNLGRFAGGSRLGEGKGLLSQVFDGKAIRARKFKLQRAEGFSKRIVPRHMAHRLDQLRALPVFEAETSLSLKAVRPVLMSFEDIDADVCVFCNDRSLGFFERGRTNWGDLTLTASLKKGSNKIRMVLWGNVGDDDLKKVRFYSLAEAITSGGKWSCRRWRKPAEVSPPAGDVEQGLPCWYVSGFKYAPDDRPLFLELASAGKGQIFLNGRNVGRWWSAGPQRRYYLPASLLSEDNELLVFSEAGPAPEGAKLVFCPRGPYDV